MRVEGNGKRVRTGGFTLIETMVAIFLVAIAVLAAAPMFMYAVRTNATGARLGGAGAAAVERLELLRGADYAALAVGGSLTTDLAGFFDGTDPDFLVRWQVADNAALSGTKMILVRGIARGSGVGRQKQVTLSLLRGR